MKKIVFLFLSLVVYSNATLIGYIECDGGACSEGVCISDMNFVSHNDTAGMDYCLASSVHPYPSSDYVSANAHTYVRDDGETMCSADIYDYSNSCQALPDGKEVVRGNILDFCAGNEYRTSDMSCQIIPDGYDVIPVGDGTSILAEPCESPYIRGGESDGYECILDNDTSSPEYNEQECDDIYNARVDYCTSNGGIVSIFNCTNALKYDWICEYPDISSDVNSTPNDYNQTITTYNPDTNTTETEITQQIDDNGTVTTTTTQDDGTIIISVTTGGGLSGGSGGGGVDRDYTDLLNSINQGVKNNTDSMNKNLTGGMPTDTDDTSTIDSFIDGIETIDESNYQTKIEEQFTGIYDSYSSKVLTKFTSWLDASNLDNINPFVLLNNYYLSHQFQTISIDLSATNVELLANAPAIDFTEELVITKFQRLYDITNIIFIFLGVLQGFLIFSRTIAND